MSFYRRLILAVLCFGCLSIAIQVSADDEDPAADAGEEQDGSGDVEMTTVPIIDEDTTESETESEEDDADTEEDDGDKKETIATTETDAAEATTTATRNLTTKFTPYNKDVHAGRTVTIKIPGAQMDDETYARLRRLILRILNRRARLRRLQTTSTPMEETTAAEGSGELEGDVGSGEVGGQNETEAEASTAAAESVADETGARRRRRQADGGKQTKADDDLGPYTLDDIEFIKNAETGSFSIVVRDKENDGTGDLYLPAAEVAQLLDEHQDEIKKEMGVPKDDSIVNEPLPPQAERVGEAPVPPEKRSVWDTHFGLFITIIILLALCIIVTIICCICLKCRARHDSEKTPMAMEEGKVEPLAMSNPVPDEEIVRDEAAPMLERANPSLPVNGGGQHLNKHDDDDGWVVPLDELTGLDRNLPDVENTRL